MPATPQELVTPSRPMELCPQSREPHKQSLAVEVLRNTGKLRLTARGYSMLPTLWPGDLLDIEATSFDLVHAGDVVLFTREDRFFIHRILQKQGPSDVSGRPILVTRGDSMPDADDPVFPEALLGKVIACQRRKAQAFAVPGLRWTRRCLGLATAYSARLRGLALRVHGWRTRPTDADSEFTAQEVPLG
jgi:hypothetical protein